MRGITRQEAVAAIRDTIDWFEANPTRWIAGYYNKTVPAGEHLVSCHCFVGRLAYDAGGYGRAVQALGAVRLSEATVTSINDKEGRAGIIAFMRDIIKEPA